MIFLFWFFLFLIIYTMVGYPILLEFLNKIIKHKKVDISDRYQPFITIIIPAHNEEKVIEQKIENLLNLSYNKELFEIIIASDNSTDKTNKIVGKYSIIYPERVKLHLVNKRMGKTNAQDEAVKISKGEVLVFTDANSMFKENAISELVSYLNDKNIAYVAGKLVYTNKEISTTSDSENSYWNIDLRMRGIESDLSSITAGNGSIYAVRKSDYMTINPVYSHDSIFPPKFVILGKRAVYNPFAVAFEKAGETEEDEFSRKVRMSRKIIATNFKDIQKYNIFKYGLFSLFYFSHRTLRNNLYIFHIMLYLINFVIIIFNSFWLYVLAFIIQTAVYFLYFSRMKTENKYINFLLYYIMMINAQLIGAIRELTGNSKPFWEKAETTR